MRAQRQCHLRRDGPRQRPQVRLQLLQDPQGEQGLVHVRRRAPHQRCGQQDRRRVGRTDRLLHRVFAVDEEDGSDRGPHGDGRRDQEALLEGQRLNILLGLMNVVGF